MGMPPTLPIRKAPRIGDSRSCTGAAVYRAHPARGVGARGRWLAGWGRHGRLRVQQLSIA